MPGMTELLIILVIVFVLFGAGKLPKVMGEMGKGVRSLREGMKEDEKKDAKTEEKIENKNADV